MIHSVPSTGPGFEFFKGTGILLGKYKKMFPLEKTGTPFPLSKQ